MFTPLSFHARIWPLIRRLNPIGGLLVTLDPFNHTIQGWGDSRADDCRHGPGWFGKIILLGEAQTRHEKLLERNNIGLKLICAGPSDHSVCRGPTIGWRGAVDELKRCVDGGMLGMGEMGHYSGMYRFGSPDFYGLLMLVSV